MNGCHPSFCRMLFPNTHFISPCSHCIFLLQLLKMFFFFNTKTYFSPSQKIWLYLTNYAPIATELEWIDKFSHFADDESAVTVMNKLQTNLYVYKVSQSKNNWKYPCNIWSCQIWKPQGSLCLEVRAKNRCICSAQNEH